MTYNNNSNYSANKYASTLNNYYLSNNNDENDDDDDDDNDEVNVNADDYGITPISSINVNNEEHAWVRYSISISI